MDDVIHETLGKIKPINTNKREQLFSVPCAFDIETTSFIEQGHKRGTMYVWMFGICDECIVGRTWDEFVTMMNRISELLSLHPMRRLVCYVHNLAFEFQWIRKLFEWSTVFSLDERKPVKAITTTGIEFRCSYILTNESLAKVGEHLQRYHCDKLVGDLNYTLKRHSLSELTKTELDYCLNDIKVVMCHIRECIEDEGGIDKIPLTKTGYVRRFCRDSCLKTPGVVNRKDKKTRKYRDIIKNLTLEPDEYMLLKRAFQGGFTHGNPFYTNRTLSFENKKINSRVRSKDETSAYPFVMCADLFPMSKGRKVEPEDMDEFREYLADYCCVFDVHFIGLESKVVFDSYISVSRCWHKENVQENNGRVVRADSLTTTMTEDDFWITEQMYTYEQVQIGTMYVYDKDYLPTDFVKAILKLYEDKTKLKGVSDKEQEYMLSKGMLNSCYGMTVTDICRPEIAYTDKWEEPGDVDIEDMISKYNKSRNRFLFYPWGVFVCSRNRRRILTAIVTECKNDYVYSDTDSIKYLNADKHEEWFERYNQSCIDDLKKAMDFHGLPFQLCCPKSVDGVEHPLGCFTDEGEYNRFRYLGAKRYMTEDAKGNVSITVSGLNKKTAVPYIKTLGEDPFEVFTDDLYIPEDYTGKLTHTYIDDVTEGELTDYNGVTASYHEESSINLSGSEYRLSLASEYADYIKIIQGISILGRRLEVSE